MERGAFGHAETALMDAEDEKSLKSFYLIFFCENQSRFRVAKGSAFLLKILGSIFQTLQFETGQDTFMFGINSCRFDFDFFPNPLIHLGA